ncbi:hypothetical protein BU24DRAFT_23787 [Aaosphaeria arxii CBS 175.79]|uniref:Uncharacterized protein n=1 Tax=Aaosphaeria arxii CBS 175.79 TaxID=1450172 RepID=A0A6A5Y8F1_9PLEO|nr:uncharacterized protein BU24DRAFT_23787 [Aaosphaeria arxii CBS 175.79]KAF2021609.1 hypothetical protein BU24DRAFT_23787 [Aaosphaeria arxii CBS 175.79]
MDTRLIFRQLLRVPQHSISLLFSASRPQTPTVTLLPTSAVCPVNLQIRSLSIPRVITPSFWASMVPKSFRHNPLSQPSPDLRKEWNPATPYMVLGLLVGSQAIQILWLKRDRERFTRKAEAQIGLLREVIEKVRSGEDVDVEKVLGTGDKAMEREWEEVLKEIGDEEVLFRSKKRRKHLRAQAALEESNGAAAATTTESETVDQTAKGERPMDDGIAKVETFQGAKFY